MSDATLAVPRPDSAPLESGGYPPGLVRVLESRTFERSPTLRNLLTYLWNQRDTSISEYAIATEALGRPPAFDARTDATVRVQIGRLRQRLERFYETEGQECEERLSIPLGSHEFLITRVPAVEQLPASRPPEEGTGLPSQTSANRVALICLSAACATLLAVCLIQAYLLRSKQAQLTPVSPPWFWQKFFQNGRATRVILPTPTFFSFKARPNTPQRGAIMFRDTAINEFSGGAQSPIYQLLQHELGTPTLAENYTVTSDTFASVHLARYLDNIGVTTRLSNSADAPVEALDNENVIAIGTSGTLRPLKPYLDRMACQLGPHEESVKILDGRDRNAQRIRYVQESAERSIWPGVIAFLPGWNGRTHLLVLAGSETSALVTVLTSTHGLNQLYSLWKSKGSPEYFELVVNAEMSGRGLVRFWLPALVPRKSGQ